MDAVAALREILGGRSPGPLPPDLILSHLMSAWPLFEGSDATSMESSKLHRIESVEWQPPRLTFLIERHGGTVQGSSRAELQSWKVDLDRRTACHGVTGHRQLRPASARLDVQPIARKLADLIASGRDDPRIARHETGSVTVRIGLVISDEGPKQTVNGRRKRLRDALVAELKPRGWEHAGTGNPWAFTTIAS